MVSNFTLTFWVGFADMKINMKKALKALLMLVPSLCLTLAVIFFTDYAYRAFLKIPAVSLAISVGDRVSTTSEATSDIAFTVNNKSDNDQISGIEYTDAEFPVKIPYGSQWAVLNVDSWETRDIPVYFGDTDSILLMGAGQWFGSRFCGQNKTCILSAHVMTYFYEIEDTEPGDTVTMDTTYGKYTYEVSEKFVFSENDPSPMFEDYGTDTLFMYTCYPRTNGINRTYQRAALVCLLKEGTVYEKD